MTDTEATDPKAEATPEQKAQRHAARVIARALSKLEQGTPEEQKERWTENKTKYTGEARKLVRAMTKDGLTLQLDETKTAKAKRGPGGGKRGKKAGAGDTGAED